MSNQKYSELHVWGSAMILIVAAIVIGGIAAKSGFYPIDYFAWREDWRLLSGCLDSVVVGQCASISQFPLGYLLNSLWSGGSQQNLAWFNLLALLLPVLCLGFVRGWRMAIVAGSVYGVALVFSPLPAFYVYSGALEIQAGVFSGIFVAALIMLMFPNQQAPSKTVLVLLATSGLMLPLYKDTIVPVVGASFMLMVAIHSFVARLLPLSKPSRQTLRLVLLFGALPTAVGLLLSIGYNLLKYGVPWPAAYLAVAKATTPALPKSIEFFLGSVFSPNGGVAVFWFLPFILVIMGWRMLGLAPRNSVVWLGAISAAVSCLGLARWFVPFGWDAWGNRLMVQPMLALMVGMLLSMDSHPFTRPSAARLLRLILLCLPILFWSGYYIAVPYLSAGFGEAIGASLRPGPACGEMYRALQQEVPRMGLEFWKSETYYRCARERMLYVPSP